VRSLPEIFSSKTFTQIGSSAPCCRAVSFCWVLTRTKTDERHDRPPKGRAVTLTESGLAWASTHDGTTRA
jgi:hypothetical protein